MSNRILIGSLLCQIRQDEQRLLDLGNPANSIAFEKLLHIDGGPNDNDYLLGIIDTTNDGLLGAKNVPEKVKAHLESGNSFRSILSEINKNGKTAFVLPYELCYTGYQEFSDFAEVMNETYHPDYNFKLIDRDVLREIRPDIALFSFNEAFRDRLNGLLPTLQIDDLAFDVDFEAKQLTSFGYDRTKGIAFDQLGRYLNVETNQCTIPYDCNRHEIAKLDFLTADEIQKNVLVVSFPRPEEMDPVGYCQTRACFLEDYLKESPPKTHFTATVLTGEKKIAELARISNRKQSILPAKKNTVRRKKLRT